MPLAGTALTAREQMIVRLVADGLANGDIGKQLGITGSTVKSHLGRIFQKTGATNRANLILVTETKVRFRTPVQVAAMLQQLRDDRATQGHELGTPDWYRQEGELRVLDRLITQIMGVPA
jgi:DNA-binding CsgD family transcriptional regulator